MQKKRLHLFLLSAYRNKHRRIQTLPGGKASAYFKFYV